MKGFAHSCATLLGFLGAFASCAMPVWADGCEPRDKQIVDASGAGADAFHKYAGDSWTARLAQGRYLEGSGPDACDPPRYDIALYENYPVKECRYASDGVFGRNARLPATVRLLDPSVEQLALWSIHACRANHAADARMRSCLDQVENAIFKANNAQFPVSGIVVERCGDLYRVSAKCDDFPLKLDQPLNIPFRDGVTVDTMLMFKWIMQPLSQYARASLVNEPDEDVINVYDKSRVSDLCRTEWDAWKHRPAVPLDCGPKAVGDPQWRQLSRETYKAACWSDGNEFIDALVYARGFAK